MPDTRKKQYDHRSREGLELVQQYVEMWARDHGDLYPSVAQVDRWGDVGLQPGIPFWPRDPWFHAPMKQSTAWGEFTYDVSEARDAYSIAVHFSRGGGVALSGDTATNRWHQQRLALMDETVRRDLQIIHGFVALWSALHGGTLPTPDELTPGGSVGRSQDYWPSDPYSGGPFTVGEGLGHFTYTPGEGGAYVLSATLGASGAAPYVIEVAAPTPAP